MPADRPRPAQLTYRAERLAFRIPANLCDRLQRLGQEAGVTTHMALLSVFQMLLARYTRRDNVAVGVPAAARNRSELEGLIGFFVNTLVLRADLSGEPSFRDVLAAPAPRPSRLTSTRTSPSNGWWRKYGRSVKRNRNPLVQVLFQYVDWPPPDFHRSGLQATPLPDPGLLVRFDLELHMHPCEGAIEGEILFATDLFNHDTIERFAGHYRNLLEAALANPDDPVSKLPLLGENERSKIASWNNTSTEYPRDLSLVDLFELRTKHAPEAPAVLERGRVLSYGELASRAENLAAKLRRSGVGPGTNVGLLFERSADAVVTMLAVLKTGAAYVPIDLEYPARHQALILHDCKAIALLTSQTTDACSHIGYAGAIIELKGDSADCVMIDKRDECPSRCSPRPNDPAYVIYTSGSTGEPKGVVVPHRAVARLVLGTDYVQFGPSDRVAKPPPSPSTPRPSKFGEHCSTVHLS